MTTTLVTGSFRDPSGFLFYNDGILLRQVNQSYREEYENFIRSGLYNELIKSELLIPHEETEQKPAISDKAYKLIKPQHVPFVSYPYEWSFSQLKDAALLTLAIQKIALSKNMSLKDASAYNVQFLGGKPIFIDTLSFENYKKGTPWVAYRQFCQHFLAPLALMSRTDIRLNKLFRIFIDGFPLDLATSLLPNSCKLSFSLGLHIYMHARSQKKYANKFVPIEKINKTFTLKSFMALLNSLYSAVKKLSWEPGKTEWNDYYESSHNYGKAGLVDKERIVAEFLEKIAPKTVWDFGANTGRFSKLAAAKDIFVVAWDIDPACVDANYRMIRQQNEKNVLPLILDLTNPSPGLGWNNEERMSLAQRGPVDTVLALGLIHHLVISNNLPLSKIVSFFKKTCSSLIVEFIPKSDVQVQKLLSSRNDIFHEYRQNVFEREFKNCFNILDSKEIQNSGRTLYLMQKR